MIFNLLNCSYNNMTSNRHPFFLPSHEKTILLSSPPIHILTTSTHKEPFNSCRNLKFIYSSNSPPSNSILWLCSFRCSHSWNPSYSKTHLNADCLHRLHKSKTYSWSKVILFALNLIDSCICNLKLFFLWIL